MSQLPHNGANRNEQLSKEDPGSSRPISIYNQETQAQTSRGVWGFAKSAPAGRMIPPHAPLTRPSLPKRDPPQILLAPAIIQESHGPSSNSGLSSVTDYAGQPSEGSDSLAPIYVKEDQWKQGRSLTNTKFPLAASCPSAEHIAAITAGMKQRVPAAKDMPMGRSPTILGVLSGVLDTQVFAQEKPIIKRPSVSSRNPAHIARASAEPSDAADDTSTVTGTNNDVDEARDDDEELQFAITLDPSADNDDGAL